MSDVAERLSITINGESRDVPAGLSLAGLIAALELDTRKVAVERNREIVPRSTYGAVLLAAGDALEIVHFIGGG
jgi:thiamine biosynthesis protein ThiS